MTRTMPTKRTPARTKPAVKSSSRTATRRAPASAKRAARSKPAAPAKRATPDFQKVAFTMLSVEDPVRARAFYEDVLGLTRGLAAPNGQWTEYDLPGGGCVALFFHPNPAYAKKPGGGGAIALEVADLDALNVRLAAAGVRYMGDMVHGPRCRMSNILDSEGNALILHQLAR